MVEESARLLRLRQQILHGLNGAGLQAYLIGHYENRLPGHLCLSFRGYKSEMPRLSLILDEAGIAVSTGGACSSNHSSSALNGLSQMGFDENRSKGLLRVTLGRFTTRKDVTRFLEVLPQAVAKLVAPNQSVSVQEARSLASVIG